MDFIKEYSESFNKIKLQKKLKKSNLERNMKNKPYLLWRKDFCEICGNVEDKRILQVHHLNPSLKGTDYDNPSNCITLCFNHHALVEYGKYPKWKDRREFEKWLIKKKEREFLNKT